MGSQTVTRGPKLTVRNFIFW